MKWKKAVAAGVAVPTVLFAALWFAAPYFTDDPMRELEKQTPVRIFTDSSGKPVYAETTCDYRQCVPVPIDNDKIRKIILAVEDADFYEHSGINYSSAFRALVQNLWNRRIVSGASTITMQLAGLTLPERKKSFRRKWLQSIRARRLERIYSKERILYEYLNRIPFGGKLYGMEAASQYYFGIHASELNTAEAILLCGLPQKPNHYRPDRHPLRARRRMRTVLGLLVRHNLLTPARAGTIYKSVRIRFRDFRYPSPLERLLRKTEVKFMADAAKREFPDAAPFQMETSLESETFQSILKTLRAVRDSLKDVDDGAAVLMHNRTGKTAVLIGTLDFQGKKDGQVNAAEAVRSAGSSLKPFFYAEAMEGGKIVRDTVLEDSPVRWRDYAPRNYDGRYYGRITAARALSESLNTPAVRLLAELGEQRILSLFARLRLLRNDRENGLSMALGSAGHTLLDLTNAFRTVARGGVYQDETFTGIPKPEQTRIFFAGTCAMLSEMLRSAPIPGCSVPASWKTGTSNNNCDAWAFVWTPEYTLGVWFGNKDGRRSESLVGATAALPAAGEILERLYRHRRPAPWSAPARFYDYRPLCAISGLSAGLYCKKTNSLPVLREIPLRSCEVCRGENKRRISILSPVPGIFLAERGKKLEFRLKSDLPGTLWYADGVFLGESVDSCLFSNGTHTVRAVHPDDYGISASVELTVRLRELEYQ